MAVLLLTFTMCIAEVTDKDVVKCRVESCGGWQLNRMPQVKRFIYDDLPLFHNCQLKTVGGAKPELFLLNKEDEVVEKISLSDLSREECNDIVISKGFYKKADVNDAVPVEYANGPYVPIVPQDEPILQDEL